MQWDEEKIKMRPLLRMVKGWSILRTTLNNTKKKDTCPEVQVGIGGGSKG